MAYNKARELKKWLAWKKAEETQMREMGVSEDTIQELRAYDWKMFKAERNYQRFNQQLGDYTDVLIVEDEPEEPQTIETFEQLFELVGDPRLYEILKTADRGLLLILLMRTNGKTYKDISKETGLPEGSLRQRVSYFRKKLKKFFETD